MSYTFALKLVPVRDDDTVLNHPMECPVCGGDSIESGENPRIEFHEDRDEYETDNPMGTRGEWGKIPLSCASCGPFNVVFGNHKGSQLFAVEWGV